MNSRSLYSTIRIMGIALSAALVVGCGDYGGNDGGPQSFRPRSTLNAARSGSGDSITEFSQTVYPILRANCRDCHGGSGPGSPQIAHSDPASAYFAVLSNQKVSFTSTISSRLVQRLSSDQHYCWNNCIADGAVMNLAIQAWAALTGNGSGGSQETDETLASSRQTLADGVIEESKPRHSGGLIAFWDFKEGGGPTVFDKSGVAPAMDLTISGSDVEWMSSYGLDFIDGQATAGPNTAYKLYERIAHPNTGSQAYTVEAWITNANTDQEGPARIVSYSRDSGRRNFTLGQHLYQYDFRNRNVNPEIGNNGTPELRTYDVDRDAQATLQHLIITYDQFRGRRIYVNGVFTDDLDEELPDRLWNWDDSYSFVLGNEPTGDRQWEGKIQLAAVYDRILSQDQISQNYDAGVGKKVTVSFDIGQWLGTDATVEFVVSEFDEYSYLFCEPTFFSSVPSGLRVSNIRIQVNDTIPASGQAFKTLDTAVYSETQQLSRQCSIIAKENGAALDEFSIVFEILDQLRNSEDLMFPSGNVSIVEASDTPLEGFRTFAQLNDTMAEVTGVPRDTTEVEAVYLELKQQLPSSPDLRAFVSTHQIGISKLALEYCDAMVDDPQLRQNFFGNFEFDQPTQTAFSDSTKIASVVDSLTDNIVGDAIGNQPSQGEIAPILTDLITDLTTGCTPVSCNATYTQTVLKAACSAVLGSGAMAIY